MKTKTLTLMILPALMLAGCTTGQAINMAHQKTGEEYQCGGLSVEAALAAGLFGPFAGMIAQSEIEEACVAKKEQEGFVRVKN